MTKRQIALMVILVLAAVLFLAAVPVWARGGGGLGGETFGGGGETFGGGEFSGGGGFGFPMGGFGFLPLVMGGNFGSGGTFIFIIIIIILFNWLRNSGFRSGGGNRRYQGGQRGGPLPLEPNNLVYERAFAPAIDYARKNIEYYGTRFPHWDRGVLLGRVRQAFFTLQDAWSRLDLSGCRDYLTADLYRLYDEKLARMRERGERDIIRDINLRDQDVNLIYSRMDEEHQSFIAMIFASMYDYVINPAGEVTSGNRDKKLYFREFWEFVWQDEVWKLAGIHEEDSVIINRIKNMDPEV